MHFTSADNALMDTDQLTRFVKVAQQGSFAAVARAEGLDPSVVSRQMGALEVQLGFRLFHRSTRKVALTSAGNLYLARITPLLEEMQQAADCARMQNAQPEGKLSITASTAFGQICIVPHVSEFCHQYPGIQLDLRFTDAVIDIVAEQVDLACRLASQPDPNLVAQKLFTTCFWVCASPDYLKKYGCPDTPAELRGHDLMAFNLPGFKERWLFKDNDGNLEKVAIKPKFFLSNALAMRSLTRAGLGCSLLASWVAEEDLKAGRLVRVLPNYEMTGSDFQYSAWLLYPSRNYIPAKTRIFVDFIKQKFDNNAKFSG